ncbi:MAG: hypothetical protein P8171_23625 [Candidatus Thiodiazotropha sp.]
MKTNEQRELDKRRAEMDRDADKLVDKYLKIFEWEIPEADESRAYQMILGELRLALDRLENRL